MSNKILVIDDEPDIRQLLSITLSRMGLEAHCVENLEQGYKLLDNINFQLCLTDLKLPNGSGLDMVKHLQETTNPPPIIVITAHGSIDIAIQAMKLGAFDFINKPVDLHNLRKLITHALSSSENNSPQSSQQVPDIAGNSKPTIHLKQEIIKVSRSQAPVFITGESGSGKELVARSIHNLGARKNQPFIGINCGAIPKELMESEFFGHMKGSFTGATQDKQGLFHAAQGGTLFLDEIADLPLEMQVKLLRAIQEKTIRPIGGTSEISIDIRILSASHKNLYTLVSDGNFRNDLFYRINVIEIIVPPLRERIGDLEIICQVLLEKIAKQNSTAKSEISNDAIKALKEHSFPGNVRELENILERACALSDGLTITSESLSVSTESLPVSIEPQSTEKDSLSLPPQNGDHSRSQLVGQYDSTTESIDDFLDSIEKSILLQHLEKNRWHRTSTAEELGISFRSLRYRLKKLKLDIDKN